MRIKILVVVIPCLTTALATAQQDIPVDLVTGAAQLIIPLTEMQYGDLTVPVGLTYTATGVKPQQAADFYGINWRLLGPGEVRREVRGLPDDYTTTDPQDNRRGWLINYAQQINDFNFTSDDNLTVCADEVNDWTFIRDLNYTRDPEPDIYNFHAPGLSGRFVFGPDKLPKLMPYQDLKVEFNPVGLTAGIVSIKITKSDGTEYMFDNKEYTIRDAQMDAPVSQFSTDYWHFRDALKFASAWRLTSIKSASGAIINYCYGNACRSLDDVYDRSRILSSKKSIQLSSTASNATSTPFKQYSVQDIVTYSDLVHISSPATKIYFEVSYANLRSINVLAKGSTFIKRFELRYAGVKNASEQYGKYFLKEIVESNSLCQVFPAYKFDYYDVVYSGYGNYSGTTSLVFHNANIKQDLWGYFNDIAVSKNPTIFYYASKTGAERYRFYSITGLTPTATINGADRSVNPAKISSGSLKSITYPTGGVTTITYEPNDYHDAESNVTRYGPGLRVKRISSTENGDIPGTENLVYDYEYKLLDGKSSGKWLYRSVFGFHDVSNFYATLDDQSAESIILYNRIKVKRVGRGETIYDYYMPGMYPLTSTSPDWNATQTKFARGAATPCAAYGELRKQYFSHPFATNTNYDFERGLIYKVSDYNSTGIKVKETKYTYQRLPSPVQVVKGLRYELLKGTSNLTTGANSNSNTYVFGKYSLLANLGKVVLTEMVKIPDMADTSKAISTSTTYTYSTVHNMLKSIQAVNSEGNTEKTSFTYARDFSNLTQPLSTDPAAVSVKKLNDRFMHGAPVEVISSIVKAGVETTTSASLRLYGEFADSTGGTTRILPKELRSYNGTTGYSPAVVIPASGANQTFTASAYKSLSFIDAYDFIGNSVSTRSVNRAIKGVHIGYNKTVPLASFGNNAANEALYDGFDTYTSFGFTTISAGLSYPAGRTGSRAIQLQSGKLMERSSIVKGRGSFYRYGIWLLGTAARQVTLKTLNGATVVTTTTLAYTAADVNKWKYYEGRISVATLGTTFGLRVEADGAITVDDVSFYPESSDISISAYTPLVGKTSETDTRGTTTFYEYDALGRVKYVKDQDGNLRQSHDYYYKEQPIPQLSAAFYASHAAHQVVKNATVTFTLSSLINCGISPLTYSWYVNDVLQGSSTTLNYTFSQEQQYVVSLVVTHPTYGTVSSSVNYDVKQIGTGNIASSLHTSSTSYAYCDPDHKKTFVLGLTGCYLLADVEIRWYYKIGSNWIETGQGLVEPIENRLTYIFDPVVAFNGISNLSFYSIKCDVSTTCPVTGVSATHSSTINISYNGSTQCL